LRWQADLQDLLNAVSGLLVLASTCIQYIRDPEKADPFSQLDVLLNFIHRLEWVASRKPLETLELLYSRILEDIPPTVAKFSLSDVDSTQVLGNFLHLDQRTFHKSVRSLHSAMLISDLEDIARSQL
jgi:hypothetical protein